MDASGLLLILMIFHYKSQFIVQSLSFSSVEFHIGGFRKCHKFRCTVSESGDSGQYGNSGEGDTPEKKRLYVGIFPILGGRGTDPNPLFLSVFQVFFACQNHPEVLKHVLQ